MRFPPALLVLAITLLWRPDALAAEKVRVVALFADKAMVEVDGQRRTLKKGERSPEGLLLVSCDFHEAVIEVNGKPQTLKLSTHIGGGYTESKVQEARIAMDATGSFATQGSINGQRLAMIVDTGATLVAINSNHAKQLGLDYRKPEKLTQVMTAGGNAPAYQVELERVQVGTIELTKVPGVVLEGKDPPLVLLGMSFLAKVKMENTGNTMILKSR